jgi:hypothetical protein
MKQSVSLALIALVAVASLVTASDKVPGNDVATVGPWTEYSLEAALTELEVDYGLWLEATLTDVQPEVGRLEKAMMSLVNYDIFVTQEKVRALAKAAARQSWQEKRDTLQPPSDETARMNDAIGQLNTKEALYRSITRTTAFSNKYRLLGDYINLLRRELELPRLKLATEKVTDPSGDMGSSVPNHK